MLEGGVDAALYLASVLWRKSIFLPLLGFACRFELLHHGRRSIDSPAPLLTGGAVGA
jgi:hypothetical protein